MGLTNFLIESQAWLLEEQKSKVESPGNTLLVNNAVGGTTLGDDYADALRQSQASFDPLEDAKLAVLSALQDGGPSSIAALAMQYQSGLISEINTDIADIEAKRVALKEALNNAPPRVSDKTTTQEFQEGIRVLNDFYKPNGFDNGEDERPDIDNLRRLVDAGLVEEEEVLNFIRNNPTRIRKTNKIQVVNQIKDRYYTVDPIDYEALRLSEYDSYRLVDENGDEVEEITGAGTGQIASDGTITFTGNPDGLAQNETIQVFIRPEERKSGTRSNSPRTNRRKDLKDKVSDVEEEFYYEIWACAVINLADYILGAIENILFKLTLSLRSLRNMEFLLNATPLGGLAQDLSNLGANLNSAQASVNQLLSAGPQLSNFIRNQLTFQRATLPGVNDSICGFNRSRYCQIKVNLDNFSSNILSFLDSLDYSFDPIDIPFDLDALIAELRSFYDELVNKIGDLQDEINELKGVICRFVERGRRGEPRQIEGAATIIIAIQLILSAAPLLIPASYGIEFPAEIVANANKLRKLGFVRSATAILSGDMQAFLNASSNTASHAGSVSIELALAANRVDNDSKRKELESLSSAARARGQQKVAAARVRNGARERFNNKNNVTITEEIVKQATVLVSDAYKPSIYNE